MNARLHYPGERLSRMGGFSLVEVMVALIVTSVGLLGIAMMQALALSSTGVANLRSLAAIQAASLASAMHADRTYWINNSPTFTVTATPASYSFVNTTDPGLAAATTCLTPLGGAVPDCAPAAMAAADVQDWAANLGRVLPNAQGTVTCSVVGVPTTCTVTINWAENIVSVNAQSAGNGAAMTGPSYTLLVEP